MKKNTKLTILCGDTHGEIKSLLKKIDHCGLRDCLIIMVGDGGEGFIKPDLKQVSDYKYQNEEFKSRNIEYWALRGNHSDPKWFAGQINYSNFKLLPDYTVANINGQIWQFVGGAISVDRKYRVEGRDYWRDEVFVLDEKKAVKCDVLVTHSAPPWLGPPTKSPFVESFSSRDVHLIDELTEERKQIQKLYEICQPKVSYAGHFHAHYSTKYENQKYSCVGNVLDILEFVEHRQYE